MVAAPTTTPGTLLTWSKAALMVPLAVGLYLRLRFAWTAIDESIDRLPDDAFYYFQIASNIASGHNVSFDGETLTNGFHPLWAALLTPIYLFVDDRELAVHIGLTIAAFLSIATAALVFLAVDTLTRNQWAALAAGSFFALHPTVMMHAMNGLESTVTVFTVALVAWQFLRIACGEDAVPRAAYVWLGVFAGLMVLARTDTIFLIPPLLLYFVARTRDREGLVSASIVGGAAGLVVLPWLIWSFVTFGTVVQVSGVAVPDIERQAYLDEHGDALTTQLERSLDVTRVTFAEEVPSWYLAPSGQLNVPLFALGGAMVVFMLVAPFSLHRERARRWLGLYALLASGVVMMLLFHSAARWHLRDWYYAPVGLFAALLLGIVVAYADGLIRGTSNRLVSVGSDRTLSIRGRAWGLVALYGMLAAVIVGLYSPAAEDDWVIRLPHRQSMLQAATWIDQNTDDDARIGSFNAGIIGYFSDRTVVNLDGVVNADAYEARRDGRTIEYFCDKELGYLVDFGMARFDTGAACKDPPSHFEFITSVGRASFLGSSLDVLQVMEDRDGPAGRGKPR